MIILKNVKKRTSFIQKKSSIQQRLPKKAKAIMIAICCSVFIGILFGSISLQMAKQEMGFEETKVHSVEENQQEDAKNEGTSTNNMEEISFYVVQGGVFSEIENAETYGSKFTKKGFPATAWKNNEEDVYLFTGIAATEEEATDIAEEMVDKELEVYVKEWQVEPKQLSGSEADYQFINQFLELWHINLDDQEFKESAWQDMLNHSNEVNEDVDLLKEEIQTLIEDEVPLQQFLLEAMYTYESRF